MTTMTWKAMGIAILMVPVMASANPNGGNTQQIPNCLRAVITVDSYVDPMLQYYEANVINTCNPNAVISGTAELIVEDQVVATTEIGPGGRALLQHLRGTSLSDKPACVVFRGIQLQPCDHKNNDSPGHLRHGVSFPIHEVLCDYSEQSAAR